VLAGEVQGKTDRIGHFYGSRARPCLHLPLNYALLDAPWNALSLQAAIDAFVHAVPPHGWPDWAIGGHDKKRIAQRLGPARARLAAMLLMTLPGTPFLFAGDEIGMTSVPIPPDRINDPFEKLVPGFGLNRDPERAPMPWAPGQHGGFTTGRPWLPMADDIAERNVETLRADPRSVLSLYRTLIRLRQEEAALRSGRYVPRRSRHDVLWFERADAKTRLLVALNMSEEPRRMEWEGFGRLMLSTHMDHDARTPADGGLLRGHEGVIVKQT
jgi:alpha-glucosidase